MISYQKYADREEWLRMRMGSVGGSEAGAVMGDSAYQSAYTLWCEKTGRAAAFAGNNATQLGNELEELTARLFCMERAKQTGKETKVRRCRRMIYNDRYPWAHANIDRIITGAHAVLECKTTARGIGGEIPKSWYWQLQHYMAVGEYSTGWLAVLDRTGKQSLMVKQIERNEADIEKLMQAEKEFMRCVRDGIQPPLTGIPRECEINRERWPESDESAVIRLPEEEWKEKLNERSVNKHMIRSLEQDVRAADAALQAAMGRAEKAVCGPYTISWKKQRLPALDRDAIQKDHPDFRPEKYSVYSRVLRVTENGNTGI